MKVSLFLQEAADQAVVPVVAPAVAPVVVTVIMDLTEREAQEQVQHNKININTGRNRKPKNRINPNINTGSRRKPRSRININTNISIGRNPGLRISPISPAILLPIPEECGNSLPITERPK
ncbi:MAG: hypothetical protein PVH67_10030 [Desulfobacterales bacterium]